MFANVCQTATALRLVRLFRNGKGRAPKELGAISCRVVACRDSRLREPSEIKNTWIWWQDHEETEVIPITVIQGFCRIDEYIYVFPRKWHSVTARTSSASSALGYLKARLELGLL